MIPVEAPSKEWSAAVRLLGLWVPIPPGTWMPLALECCVFSGRGLLWADHSSRGILPTVVCPVNVIMKPPKGRPWSGIGSKCHKKEMIIWNLGMKAGCCTCAVARYVIRRSRAASRIWVLRWLVSAVVTWFLLHLEIGMSLDLDTCKKADRRWALLREARILVYNIYQHLMCGWPCIVIQCG